MKQKVAMFVLFLFIGCFLINAADARTSEGEFRIAVTNLTTEILDPTAGPTDTKWYLTLLYDSVVGIEPPSTELSSNTGLASSWKHSPDYKVWTFNLREGIKFHNGDEVTADDFKFTLERALGPGGVSSNKSSLAKTIDTIEADPIMESVVDRVFIAKPVAAR